MFIYKTIKNRLRGESKTEDAEKKSKTEENNSNDKVTTGKQVQKQNEVRTERKEDINTKVKSPNKEIVAESPNGTLRKLKYGVANGSNPLLKLISDSEKNNCTKEKSSEASQSQQEIKELIEIECNSYTMKYIEKEFERVSVPCDDREVKTVEKLMKEGKIVKSDSFQKKTVDFKGGEASDPEKVVLFTIGDSCKDIKQKKTIPQCSADVNNNTKDVNSKQKTQTASVFPKNESPSLTTSIFTHPKKVITNVSSSTPSQVSTGGASSISSKEKSPSQCETIKKTVTTKPVQQSFAQAVDEKLTNKPEGEANQVTKKNVFGPKLRTNPFVNEKNKVNDKVQSATSQVTSQAKQTLKSSGISTDSGCELTSNAKSNTASKNINKSNLETKTTVKQGKITKTFNVLEDQKLWSTCFQNMKQLLQIDEQNSPNIEDNAEVEKKSADLFVKVKKDDKKKPVDKNKSKAKRKRALCEQQPKSQGKNPNPNISRGYMRFLLSDSHIKLLSERSISENDGPEGAEAIEHNINKTIQNETKKSAADGKKKKRRSRRKNPKGIKEEIIPKQQLCQQNSRSEDVLSPELSIPLASGIESSDDGFDDCQDINTAISDVTPRESSPTDKRLQRLQSSLEKLQRRTAAPQFQWSEQFPNYNGPTLNAKVVEENPAESLYNFNSHFYRYIEHSPVTHMKTNTHFTEQVYDNTNLYERILTNEKDYQQAQERIKSPDDYPAKASKLKHTEDIVGLQIMLNEVFGHETPSKKEDNVLNSSVSSLDFIPASPNTSLSGINCSFTKALTNGKMQTYLKDKTEKQRANEEQIVEVVSQDEKQLLKDQEANLLSIEDREYDENDSDLSDAHSCEEEKLIKPYASEKETPFQVEEQAEASESHHEEQAKQICNEVFKIFDRVISNEEDDDDEKIADNENKKEENGENKVVDMMLTLHERKNQCFVGNVDNVIKILEEMTTAAVEEQKTRNGFTLKDCLDLFKKQWTSYIDLNHIGFFACDPYVYTDFKQHLAPMLQELHWKRIGPLCEQYGISKKDLNRTLNIPFNDHESVIECVLEFRRCLRYHTFPMACRERKIKTKAQRLLKKVCQGLKERFDAVITPLSFTDNNIEELVSKKILTSERNIDNLTCASLCKFDEALLLLNYKEHFHLILSSPGLSFRQLFNNTNTILSLLVRGVTVAKQKIVHDQYLGYSNPDPRYLGQACTLTIRMALVNISKIKELKDIMETYGVQLTARVWDEKLTEYIYNFQNKYQFDCTELQAMLHLESFSRIISEINWRIKRGEVYDDVIEFMKTHDPMES